MKITEVRVKMVGEDSERLRAFCSVTIDDSFVIRDLKVIDGDDGPFVAMPSRKMSDHCGKCGEKNHLRAKFCNECGTRLNANRAPRDTAGRIKLYADVAHPINVESREMIQAAVIQAFNEELALSLEPGYSQSDEVFEEFDDEPVGFDDLIAQLRKPKPVEEDADTPPAPRRRETGRSDRERPRQTTDRPIEKPPVRETKPSREEKPKLRREEKPSAPSAARPQDVVAPAAESRRPKPIADSDVSDFAAGLDWSPPPAAKQRVTPAKDDAPGNGRNRAPQRKRQEDDADIHRPTDESPEVAPVPTQGVDPSSQGDDEFGAGIL